MNDMGTWSTISDSVLSAHGVRHKVHADGDPVTTSAALDMLAESRAFRAFLTRTILSAGYTALRWETPPVTTDSIGRPFEFVLVNDPFLDAEAEPEVFAPYFAERPADVSVLAISNLGGTARLVVPRELTRPADYVHLKVFLEAAPDSQVHALWQCVARTARKELSAHPLWISTAGGGVNWLHVRLERSPKYYSYRPYANAN
jgi:hypothetical protein